MKDTAHAARISALHRWLAFDRVIVPDTAAAPAIVLAAHYNGLLDGFVYLALSPRMLGVISAQWHRSAIGRFLLPAIAVTRGKDKREDEGNGNLGAFKTMLASLENGNALLYFPEGTSRLGPERLPVQRGTELLLRMARKEHPDLPVYFAAAHYEHPTRWRSRVRIALDGPHAIPEARSGLGDWVSEGLLRAQSTALAQPFPDRLDWLPRLRRALAALLLLPVAPARLAARWAIRRKADDSNVIALWRLLGGVPAALLCWLAWAGIGLATDQAWLALAAPLSTLIGVTAWTR
jgi:1-acyl-sn-glycerol-3-phosphate acyltransferase